MISPVLVKKICKGDKTIERFETSVIRNSMCSSSTLDDIKQCLHDVVWDNDLGTASVNPWGMRKAQSKLVSIAGKTGTAQRGANLPDNALFVAAAPYDDPDVVISVVLENGAHGYYSAITATRILEAYYSEQ